MSREKDRRHPVAGEGVFTGHSYVGRLLGKDQIWEIRDVSHGNLSSSLLMRIIMINH